VLVKSNRVSKRFDSDLVPRKLKIMCTKMLSQMTKATKKYKNSFKTTKNVFKIWKWKK